MSASNYIFANTAEIILKTQTWFKDLLKIFQSFLRYGKKNYRIIDTRTQETNSCKM